MGQDLDLSGSRDVTGHMTILIHQVPVPIGAVL